VRSKSLSKSRSPLRRGTSPKDTAKYKRQNLKETSEYSTQYENDSEFSPQRKRANPLNKNTEPDELPSEGRQYLKDLKAKHSQAEVLQDSKSSLLSSTALQRIKESNLKLSVQNERAEEEIERCHDQIARQASQNHQLHMQVRSLEKDQNDLRSRYEDMQERAASEREDHLKRIAELEDELNRQM